MASSVTPGTIAQMIVQYDWILEDVDGEPQTFASKMILFRGGKVFRVGLKNHDTSQFVFFVAIDLNKMGMRVESVLFPTKNPRQLIACFWAINCVI